MEPERIQPERIKFEVGNLYSSGLHSLMDRFPADECFIMDLLDCPMKFSMGKLPGLTALSNLFLLYIIARQYNEEGKNILEIGTNRGKSSYTMATAAPLANLTSLEIYRENWLIAKRIHETGYVAEFITVPPVKTNLLLADSVEYLANYKGPKLDMIFVDGDHFEGALLDAEWWNWLNIGGCILFHDAHGMFPHVKEAVTRLEKLTGREPDVWLRTDYCIAGFYKEEGDKEWEIEESSTPPSTKAVQEKRLSQLNS